MSQVVEAKSLRSRLLLAGGIIVVVVLLAQLARSPEVLGRLPMYDFVEYWAAGRLIASGQNPYDPDSVHHLERLAGRSEDGILMWNPPWTLPLVLPFGVLPVRLAHLLWLILHLAVLGFCADRLWLLYGGDREQRWLGWIIGLAFVPTLFALAAGQITPILLLGAVGFLVGMERKRETLAGMAAVLLAVKPHLAYLFWIALLLWSIRERRWRVLAGGVAAGLVLTAIPLFFNAEVLQHYWHTFTQKPPAQYRSPTIGTVLRLAFGEGQFRLQFLAMIPGLLWFAPYWWTHRRDWTWKDQLPLLLTVSVLTTAYGGWPFDLVLLLLPVMQAATTAARPIADCGLRIADLKTQSNGGHPPGWIGLSIRNPQSAIRNRVTAALAVTLFVALNAVAVGQLVLEVEYFWFIWITPAVLLASLLVRWAAARGSPADTVAVECACN